MCEYCEHFIGRFIGYYRVPEHIRNVIAEAWPYAHPILYVKEWYGTGNDIQLEYIDGYPHRYDLHSPHLVMKVVIHANPNTEDWMEDAKSWDSFPYISRQGINVATVPYGYHDMLEAIKQENENA